jgi:hypothetical protein
LKAYPIFICFVALLILSGCGQRAAMRRTLREVGPDELRAETIAACRYAFTGPAQKIPENRWPVSVRAFQPLGLWAESDGAYLLLDSDVDGERGIYLPRIASEEDPLCSPALKHEKLATGVYWYERKR